MYNIKFACVWVGRYCTRWCILYAHIVVAAAHIVPAQQPVCAWPRPISRIPRRWHVLVCGKGLWVLLFGVYALGIVISGIIIYIVMMLMIMTGDTRNPFHTSRLIPWRYMYNILLYMCVCVCVCIVVYPLTYCVHHRRLLHQLQQSVCHRIRYYNIVCLIYIYTILQYRVGVYIGIAYNYDYYYGK